MPATPSKNRLSPAERLEALRVRPTLGPIEVAELYGVSVNFVRNEIRNGNLPAHNVGRRVMVNDYDHQPWATTGKKAS